MIKNMLMLVICLFAANHLLSQAAFEIAKEDVSFKMAETITASDLEAHLSVLASDEYEGRETGTRGNQRAAKYIADHFQSLGLPTIGENNSYFQRMTFNWTRWNNISLKVGENAYRHLWDFVSFPTKNLDRKPVDINEVVFMGYGIDDPNYTDYKKANVAGKTILIYTGEPLDKKGMSRITGTKETSEWTTDLDKKLKVAKSYGVNLVLIIENEIQKMISDNRSKLLGPQVTLGELDAKNIPYANAVYISTNIAKDIMGEGFEKVVKSREKIKKRGKSKKVILPVEMKIQQEKTTRTIAGDNVLGYIEGIDPKMKDEVVVVTAHYDHLGKKGTSIYNGADDNGSGTSTVLEVAQALTQAKNNGVGPKRSVLCMLVTGEEKGLLGSKFYSERPIFPLANTVANVNVDMVGRVDDKYIDNPNYIYVIGSDRLSTELHDINEGMNSKYTKLALDYTYNADDDPNRYYYRSDHYNFAEKGIPAIFYFNGTHADYHRTSDTIEKINFEKMEKIAKLVFHTTFELANRDKRIEVNVTGRN